MRQGRAFFIGVLHMKYIVRGTTPKLIYKFAHVDPANVRAAVLTITPDAGDQIERDLTTAVVDEDSIAWTLTQEETLEFGNWVRTMLNWVLQDGTRGTSKKTKYIIDSNDKEVVI